jgi:Rieske Fe-S protein
MEQGMSDEVERLNRVLEDLAAERDPGNRAMLSEDEIRLAETAAFLKAAAPGRQEPDPRFVERLVARLTALNARQPRHAPDGAPVQTETAAAVAPAGDDTVAMPRQPRGISRRGLLGRIAIAATGVAAGAGAGEVVRGQVDTAAASAAYERGRQEGYQQAASAPFRQPMAPDDRGRWFDTGQTVATLAPGEATRFRAGAVEGFLVNPGAGKPIYALSAACTHMGCMLSWLAGAGTFLCPCHGAQYQADGTVLSGIARHPLPRLQVRVDEHGSVYVWSVDEQPADTRLIPYVMP